MLEISEKVKKIAIENGLNRAQTRALQALQNASSEEFQMVTSGGRSDSDPGGGPFKKESAKVGLKDLSGREIGNMAERAARKSNRQEFNRPRVSPSSRPHMVKRMQRNKTLGVVRQSLIVGRKK